MCSAVRNSSDLMGSLKFEEISDFAIVGLFSGEGSIQVFGSRYVFCLSFEDA